MSQIITELNINHRDIKPGNILFKDGKALIADFGNAKRINMQNHFLNEWMTMLGTEPYMSPLVRINQPHDSFKSDVFSLGVTLLYAALLKKNDDWNRDMELVN